jgi:hypothetical protein
MDVFDGNYISILKLKCTGMIGIPHWTPAGKQTTFAPIAFSSFHAHYVIKAKCWPPENVNTNVNKQYSDTVTARS